MSGSGEIRRPCGEGLNPRPLEWGAGVCATHTGSNRILGGETELDTLLCNGVLGFLVGTTGAVSSEPRLGHSMIAKVSPLMVFEAVLSIAQRTYVSPAGGLEIARFGAAQGNKGPLLPYRVSAAFATT